MFRYSVLIVSFGCIVTTWASKGPSLTSELVFETDCTTHDIDADGTTITKRVLKGMKITRDSVIPYTEILIQRGNVHDIYCIVGETKNGTYADSWFMMTSSGKMVKLKKK